MNYIVGKVRDTVKMFVGMFEDIQGNDKCTMQKNSVWQRRMVADQRGR